MGEALEFVSCDLCGSNEVVKLYRPRDTLSGVPFDIVKCRQCGLVYVNPRPIQEEIALHYPDDYYVRGRVGRSSAALQLLRRAENQLMKPLEREIVVPLKAGSRILDVGCGMGDFLVRQRARGMDVYGVEPSPIGSSYAREKLGLPVFTGTLEQARLPEKHFDAIYLTFVIEHLPNPRETLTECFRLLKDGGVLVIVTADVATLEARLFRSYWFCWGVPRHLYLFSAATLQQLLKRTGGQIQRMGHKPSVRPILGSLWLFLEEKKVNRALALFSLSLVYAPAFLFSLVFARVNRSGHIWVMAQKAYRN